MDAERYDEKGLVDALSNWRLTTTTFVRTSIVLNTP